MANIKSQIKRNKTNEKARVRNVSYKSKLRTAIKAVKVACEAKDKEKASEALKIAIKRLDKACAAGVVTSNYVARNKSRLTIKVNSID